MKKLILGIVLFLSVNLFAEVVIKDCLLYDYDRKYNDVEIIALKKVTRVNQTNVVSPSIYLYTGGVDSVYQNRNIQEIKKILDATPACMQQ